VTSVLSMPCLVAAECSATTDSWLSKLIIYPCTLLNIHCRMLQVDISLNKVCIWQRKKNIEDLLPYM
jgi:hypothetical protein